MPRAGRRAAPAPGRQLRGACRAPPTGVDRFEEGDLASTSVETCARALAPFPFARVHEGVIPAILEEVGDRARSRGPTSTSTSTPRCGTRWSTSTRAWSPGGTIVLDDYGFPSCPGARRAVDEFFAAAGRRRRSAFRPANASSSSCRSRTPRASTSRGRARRAGRGAVAVALDGSDGGCRARGVRLLLLDRATSPDPGRSYYALLADALRATARPTCPSTPAPELLALRRSVRPGPERALPAARRVPLRGPLLPLLRPDARGARLPSAAGRRRATSSDRWRGAAARLGGFPSRAVAAAASSSRRYRPAHPDRRGASWRSLASGSANVVPFILRRPAVYEVAIAAGFCFLMAGVLLLVAARCGAAQRCRSIARGQPRAGPRGRARGRT